MEKGESNWLQFDKIMNPPASRSDLQEELDRALAQVEHMRAKQMEAAADGMGQVADLQRKHANAIQVRRGNRRRLSAATQLRQSLCRS